MEDCLHRSNGVLTIPIPDARNRGRRCGDVRRYAVVGVQGEGGFEEFGSTVGGGCRIEDDEGRPRPPRPDIMIDRAAARTPR